MLPPTALTLSALIALAAQLGGDSDFVLGPLIMNRGEDRQEVYFPRNEELTYDVAIDLGVLGEPSVGGVVITSKVRPFARPGATLGDAQDEPVLEQAIVAARARGEYQVYSLDETITTRVQPLAWPHLFHDSVQKGTENRRRELSIGSRDGETRSSYRSDGHCKGCEDDAHFVDPTFFWNDRSHCDGCKSGAHRVWREPREKGAPDDVVDMVTAVMLARTVVQQGKSGAKFTLLDREKLWDVEISRGRRERREVAAGTFDAVEVVLVTRPPKGEKGREGDFQGLFGLHGNISIWMHPESGVPVEIAGTLPAGPLEFDVRVQLDGYSGTPASFRKVVK
jgi:hypothetical protein